jgi:AmmeMemoRadiSam system protein B
MSDTPRRVIFPRMDAVRPPAVAGSFYPADPIELRETVSRLLAAARPGPVPKAVIAPHAAYVYSGPVAASAFRRVVDAPFTRVVLLGPSHFVHVRGLVLPEAAAMNTPLGNVSVEDLPLPRNGRAHAREHSLEVELPFLQVALRLETAAPLAVGETAPEEVAGVLDQNWGGRETLLVVSSDLSHYLPYEDAKTMDAATAKEILALGRITHEDACGADPINGLLRAAKQRGMRSELIDLRNSGDTAGDKRRVVGYGAFAFYEKSA